MRWTNALVVGLAGSFAACSAGTPGDSAVVHQPAHDLALASPAPLSASPVATIATDASPPAAALSATAAPAPPPPLPKGTTVLHVGDSFVHSGLTQALKPKLEALGVHYEVRGEKSTNSLDWAKRVPELVASIKPDLVIVTLGGNEIGSEHLDVQARAVHRIVEAIGDRPCIWTTPPLWREEEGLFDTIASSLGHCRFFETDRIVGKFIPRREDKIHPTPEGGAMWADALYDWTMHERIGAPSPWALAPSPEDEKAPRGKRNALPH